ncbi:MAG TPA: thioredoxin-like domain-containing protein [Arachidicoccus sp.]|nr:thioredoxin-like domain-containing protein [Arachidicoccus sp.]
MKDLVINRSRFNLLDPNGNSLVAKNTNSKRLIKFCVALFTLCSICMAGYCQTGATGPQSKVIPHFNITQINGEPFNYQQLKKNKPLVLIYFSPDCGHCADFTSKLLKSASKFKDKQIVMVCWEPLQTLLSFQKLYNFAPLSNLKIGTEGYSFYLQKFYQIHYFPFIAVFNADGQLVQKLGNKAGLTDMSMLLNQLLAVRL